jgi:hypothetical protein
MAGYRAPDPQRPQIQRIAYRQTQTARLVGLVLMWSIIALVALAADRAIPREHLPWKPLALVDPIGAATRIKAARTGEDPAACREVLKQGGVEFVDVAARTSGFCDVHDAVRIEAGMAPLSPTDAPMTCKQALAVSLWERQVVQQAAFDAFGQAVGEALLLAVVVEPVLARHPGDLAPRGHRRDGHAHMAFQPLQRRQLRHVVHPVPAQRIAIARILDELAQRVNADLNARRRRGLARRMQTPDEIGEHLIVRP